MKIKYLYATALSLSLTMPAMAEWIYAGRNGETQPSADYYPYAHKVHNGDTDPDGKKTGQITYGGDSNMCWAAAASNLIEYWQQRYVNETGKSLPVGAPSGPSEKVFDKGQNRGSAIYDYFADSHLNMGLGSMGGLLWYFGGYYENGKAHFPYTVTSEGAFWKDYCAALGYSDQYAKLNEHSYVESVKFSPPTMNEYHLYPDPKDYDALGNAKAFSNSVRTALESNALVSLGVSDLDINGHAITLYGADFGQKGDVYEVKDKAGNVVRTIDLEGLIKTVYVQDNNNAAPPKAYDLAYGFDTETLGYIEDKPGAEQYPYKDFEYAKMWLDGYNDDRFVISVEYLTLPIVDGRIFSPSNDTTFSDALSGEDKLVMIGEGTLTLTGANTHTGGTDVMKGTLVAESAEALGSEGAVTVSGGTLRIGAEMNLGDRLTQTGGAIEVTKDGKLELGSTTISSAIRNEGSITFTGDISTTGLAIKDGEGQIGESENGFKTYQETLTVVTGKGGITVDGKIQVTQDGKNYTLGKDGTASRTAWDCSTYHLRTGDGDVSAMIKLAEQTGEGGALKTVEMASSGTLTVNAAIDTLNINTENAKVVLVETGSVTNLNVNKSTTVSGHLSLTEGGSLTLAKGGFNSSNYELIYTSVTLQGGISTSSGVNFGGENSAATISNEDWNNSTTYSLDNKNAKVTAKELTSTGKEDVTVGNRLAVENIVNDGTGTLTVTGTLMTEGKEQKGILNSIEAKEGNIIFKNVSAKSPIELSKLTIAGGKEIAVYTGEKEISAAEGSITVAGLLTAAENSTLSANLVIADGATLDFANGAALVLGSDLTLGTNMSLGSDLVSALNGMGSNEVLTLVQAKDGTTLGYGGDYNGREAGTLFNTEDWANAFRYNIVATDESFGIQKIDDGSSGNIPEPTTTTLSLLALAALAARRRRK